MQTRPTLAAAMTALTLASLLACGASESAETQAAGADVPATIEAIDWRVNEPVEEDHVDPSSSVSGTMTMLPPSADIEPITLQYEAGHTGIRTEDGTPWVSFGAVIENPADQDVYDVVSTLTYVDANDIAWESTTFTLPSLPAGHAEHFSYTGPIEVEGFHTLTFEVTGYAYAGDAPALRPSALIELRNVQIDDAADDVGVLARVINPGPDTIDELAVVCVLRVEGEIVGGDHMKDSFGLAAGQWIDFELRNSVVPAGVDEADCQASAVGLPEPA